MHALDVIHSFWVPEWRIKKDNVPGDHDDGDRHPGQGRHLPAGLHRALRLRPRLDAGKGRGRVPERTSANGSLASNRNVPTAADGSRSADDRVRHRRPSARAGHNGGDLMAAAIKQPGLDSRRARRARRCRLRLRPRDRPAGDLRPAALPDRADRLPARRRAADPRSARLPRRLRLLRLLAALGRRAADDPRGPLPARRQELEGLLPLQHRSQGDRHPVHRAPPSSSSSSAA